MSELERNKTMLCLDRLKRGGIRKRLFRYWRPRWLNCITHKPGQPKIYLWLWFVFTRSDIRATETRAKEV